MMILDSIFFLVRDVVWCLIFGTIILMILRLIITYAAVNPFGRIYSTVRRSSDPLVQPVRHLLISFGADSKYAPLVTVLLVILVGYFALQLTGSVHATLAGMLLGVKEGSVTRIVGFFLYGLLDLYVVLIFIRIIFSWAMVSYTNRVMRFLINTTEPLLGPLRRMLPMLGPFDVSPIVAVIVIWLFQQAIAGTLLSAGPRAFSV